MKALSRFLRWYFRHLYTDLAWSYDLVAWVVSLGRWNEWALCALEGLPPGRVLELGHGPGHLLCALAGRGRNPVGIDPSPQMGRLARRRMRRRGLQARLVRARAQSQPFSAAAFDGVVSTFPDDYAFDPATAAELARVLRPAGVLVVIPAATLLPQSWMQRAAAWLFRVTGQCNDRTLEWAAPLRRMGFTLQVERREVRGSIVLRLVARRSPA